MRAGPKFRHRCFAFQDEPWPSSITHVKPWHTHSWQRCAQCYFYYILNCVSCDLEQSEKPVTLSTLTNLLPLRGSELLNSFYFTQRVESFSCPSSLTFKWVPLWFCIVFNFLEAHSGRDRNHTAFPNPLLGGEVGETKCGKTAKQASEFIRCEDEKR